MKELRLGQNFDVQFSTLPCLLSPNKLLAFGPKSPENGVIAGTL